MNKGGLPYLTVYLLNEYMIPVFFLAGEPSTKFCSKPRSFIFSQVRVSSAAARFKRRPAMICFEAQAS